MSIDPWADVSLEGVVDMHVHSSPDIAPRSGDDLVTVGEADAAGMAAIVLKSHHTLTSTRAYLCQQALRPAVRVYGGIALNPPVGGLNPRAVEAALALGARVIWMPTYSARHMRRADDDPQGLAIVGDDDALLPEVLEILDLAAGAGAVVCSGHLSPGETLLLLEACRERGVRGMVVTHPELPFVDMPIGSRLEAVRFGAFVEHVYVSTTRYGGHISFEALADQIRAVGVSHVLLATDLGQADTPRPVAGMREFIWRLGQLGFSDRDLHRMTVENPATVLGLA